MAEASLKVAAAVLPLWPRPQKAKQKEGRNAKYFASLTATDSQNVNELTSKWIASELDNNRLHVASWCAQHKTCNAMQQVSEYLGLIRPGFCIASCLSVGDIADDLDEHLRQVLEEDLDVVDPATVPLDDDRQRQQDFLLELYEQCHVLASGPDGDTEEDRTRIVASSEKRRRDAKETLAFFAAPGKGRLRHACPPGCCGPADAGPASNRASSLNTAFGLGKHFVAPCITEPAANKYTKVDPVMRKLAFMTKFGEILRKAVGRK